MDKRLAYRQQIQALLQEYTTYFHKAKSPIRTELLFDTERDHYQILRMGWEQGAFVYYVSIHLDLIDEQIWLQQNNTEFSVARDLVKRGVPASDIVLGFHEPDIRAIGDYAVGV